MVHINGLTAPNSANLQMEMCDIRVSFLILLFFSLGTGGNRSAMLCKGGKTSFTCSQGSQYFRLNLFMLNISLLLIITKGLPTQPDPFQPLPAPLRSDSLQSNTDRYVSGRVIASEWCALIVCGLLQDQFVCLSLEGATGLRAQCDEGS